jgi:hypothetical protein
MRLKAGDILLLPHGSAHFARGRVSNGQDIPPIATEYRDSAPRPAWVSRLPLNSSAADCTSNKPLKAC